MYRRPALLTNISLALIVLILLTGEIYILFLKQKFGGHRVAAQSTCRNDGVSNIGSYEALRKDVYVNCSGFQG